MTGTALLIGNSDGIGLATTRRLLARGWTVIGVSRSTTTVRDHAYAHYVCDVTSSEYRGLLDELARKQPIDLCIYSAGVGELLDPGSPVRELWVVDVNLMGMIRTVVSVIPAMVSRRRGHFIGISSFADELLSAEAPSYHASKAGFSNYLQGLALAVRRHGVQVTNVRFGFVDTKMAKGDKKPLMMSVERAVDHLERCMARRPRVYVAPRAAIPLVKLHKWIMRLRR